MSNFRRDKRREKYSRNTEGWNAQGFFSPSGTNAAYATETTVASMALAAATKAGTIGIYNADTGALITGAVGTASPVIIQKNSDGELKRSTDLPAGAYSTRKVLYSAAAVQKDIVSPLAISIVGGLQEFVLSVREQTPGNQPFPVMEGRAIVRGGAPTDYDIANAIVTDINNSYDFERNADNAFVSVNVITDITGVAATVGTGYTLTDGSDQLQIAGADATGETVVGDYVIINAFSPEPATIFQIVAAVYDGTNTYVTLDRTYSNSQPGGVVTSGTIAQLGYEVEANVVAATTGIEVIGKDELVHFETAVSEDLAEATITNTVAWNMGTGEAFQVASIEDECIVFDGYTTGNAAFANDYGVPDLYVNDISSDTYVLYIFESDNRIIPSAGAPVNQTLMRSNLVIAAIVGSGLETNLDTIFGF